jgi:hypothetical protein
VAKIGKYVLVVALVAAVAAAAVYVAVEVELLAGALVVLAALIVVVLVVRFLAARAEKSGIEDWKEVLAADAPDDAFFSDWTSTSSSLEPVRPGDDLDVDAHTAAGLEGLEDLALEDLAPSEAERPPSLEAPSLDGPGPDETPEEPHDAPVAEPTPPVESSDRSAAEPTETFPWDDPADDWGDLPPLVPRRPGAADGGEPQATTADHPEPAPEPGAEDEGVGAPEPAVAAATDPTDPPAPNGTGRDAHHSGPKTFIGDLTSRSFEPDPSPVDAEAMSLAGVTSSPRPRRSVIDWNGPVHAVDEQVRTSDDILKASAATALPSPEDQPAPVGGSELARLLSKVEARLRDYE